MSQTTISVLKTVDLASLKDARIKDVYTCIAGNEYRPMLVLNLDDGRQIRILDGSAFTDSEETVKFDLQTFTFKGSLNSW